MQNPPEKLPVSAIVLVFNEEKNIEDCLKSLQGFADEIFVVDSYSTDKTLEIAGKYTDKLFQRSFNNYSDQRNWAQENLPIRNEWVFHLDADERVGPRLVLGLQRIFSSEIKLDGFIIPRKTVFRGRWIKHGGHYPVYHLRLFKRSRGRCENRLYDQHYILDGKSAKIEGGDIINIIEPDLRTWFGRHKKWAYLEAIEVINYPRKAQKDGFTNESIMIRRQLKNRIYYKMPLFMRVFIYYFLRYILLGGFLDGWQGAVFHFWQGFWYRFLVDVTICELKRKNVYLRA